MEVEEEEEEEDEDVAGLCGTAAAVGMSAC